jgi:hypothetical protein
MLYRAQKDADGTYTIFDVPVFGELPKGARGNEETIDRSWMLAAVDNAHLDFQERGYLPPLNLRHRDGSLVIRSGHFRLTRVGTLLYEGRKMPAIFADLCKVPQSHFDAIVRGDWPYRSPEVHYLPDGSWPKIGEFRLHALALLDIDDPFFRFSMLNGETVKLDAGSGATLARYDADAGPCRGVLTAPKGAVALFAFKEKSMPPPEKTEEDAATRQLRDQLAAKEREVAELKAKLAKSPGDVAGGEEGGKDGPKPAEFTALHAEVASLSARLDKREREDEVDARYKAAVAELKGWHLSEQSHASLRKVAGIGPDATKEFIALFKARVPREPLPFDRQPAAAEQEPPELAKFSNEGPDRLEAARKASREYDQLKQAGVPLASNRESFILSRIGKAA